MTSDPSPPIPNQVTRISDHRPLYGCQGGVRVLRASQVAVTSLISCSNKSGSVGVHIKSGYLLVSAPVNADRGTQTSLRELRCEKP